MSELTGDAAELAAGMRADAAAYRKSVYDPDPQKLDQILTLDYQWADKPHRHVGDLCSKLEEAAALIEQQAAQIAGLVEALEEISARCFVSGETDAQMYSRWRKLAVTRVDIARAALAKVKP